LEQRFDRDAIGFNVTASHKKMVIVLHGKTLVATLIQVAAGGVVVVGKVTADVGGRQAQHEAGQFAVLSRPEQQMPVVGHEAPGQHAHAGHRLADLR